SDNKPYYDFPFCPPGDPIPNRKKSFVELLAGDCLTPTQYELKFRVNTTMQVLCEKSLTKDDVSKLRKAAIKRSKCQMYFNGFAFNVKLGVLNSSERVILFNHVNLYPHYYKNQVKFIYSLSDLEDVVDITEVSEMKVNFTYSVFWQERNWESPAETKLYHTIEYYKYLTVIILVWMLLQASYLEYLRRYFTRCKKNSKVAKLLRRRPPYPSLLGAILGIGIHHLLMICILFVMKYKDALSPCESSVLSKLPPMYCFLSVVSGGVATWFHARYSLSGWKECVLQTATLYFVPAFCTTLVSVASEGIFYGRLHLPESASNVVKWVVVTVISLFLGGNFGFNFSSGALEYDATIVLRNPRNIRKQSWWMSTPAQMLLGGLLPFMTIFWNMDEIYASLHNLKVCGAFSTLFTAFLTVITVTVIVGMVFTHYDQKQDQWWWRSVLRGGSTAIYVYFYGIYFHYRTDIRGAPKMLMFLGLNGLIFYSFFLVLGTIGFFASSYIAH
ncbi:EMP70 domain-containing protein, partial [Cephalotus follicularis]